MHARDPRPRREPQDSDSQVLLPPSDDATPHLGGAAAGGRPGQRVPLERPASALFSVDGAGEYLLVVGDHLKLGHVHAGRADLPLLADVGPVHAELVRTSSLGHGPSWKIVPLNGERVTLGGEPIGPRGATLRHGARLCLGTNAGMRFRQPDPASRTALLELGPDLECAGAARIVLMSPGRGGRLRTCSAEAACPRCR